jgi:MFS superfamily sulfate permease-like transporter
MFVKQKLQKYEDAAQSTSVDIVQYVILDFSSSGNIDTTALYSLKELVGDYKARGVQLCLCNPGVIVMERLVKSGFIDIVGYENVFVSEHQAARVCFEKVSKLEKKTHIELINVDAESSILAAATISDDADKDCEMQNIAGS